MMREAEGRELEYLFKLKLTKNVKKLIERAFMKGGWRDAGQGWQGSGNAQARGLEPAAQGRCAGA
jgi:hypothetical protein